MRAAETARRARDGSTAAQHDQNVNVAAPAMRAAEVARNTRDGITAAQHNARATIQAPAMRAAEVERRARYGSTAAQLDQCIDWQEAGSMAFQEKMAAAAAASGDPICVRAGCRRKARINRNGVPYLHGRCKK